MRLVLITMIKEEIIISHIHLILEVYCLHGIGENAEKDEIPEFCKYGVKKPGFHCMENKCKQVVYTDAPYELAYSDNVGEVIGKDSWIGFGGDMEFETLDETVISNLKKQWENVCKRKIKEAYNEYMQEQVKKNKQSVD